MMKKINCEQGSEQWLMARLGVPTASESESLVTPLWKVRDGKGLDTYVATKLAEKWYGAPLPSYSSGAMEQGSIREGEALPFFSLETGIDLERVGFITTDDGLAGCSPDSLLVGMNEGLEAKCPLAHTHVNYLLGGELPKDYAPQVQFSMYVTGFKSWRFLSYCPGFPPLMLTVQRDENAMKAIGESLAMFHTRFSEGWARLIERNGGRAPQRRPVTLSDETWTLDDRHPPASAADSMEFMNTVLKGKS